MSVRKVNVPVPSGFIRALISPTQGDVGGSVAEVGAARSSSPVVRRVAAIRVVRFFCVLCGCVGVMFFSVLGVLGGGQWVFVGAYIFECLTFWTNPKQEIPNQ